MSFWKYFHHRDRDLDDDIKAHMAMAVRDRIERGEDPKAAELAARREFGNQTLVKETTREAWGFGSSRSRRTSNIPFAVSKPTRDLPQSRSPRWPSESA
jgi:hypothetical protein